MELGTVKWFDEAKGYGCISRKNGEEVLVSTSVLQISGFERLRAGESVQFNAVKGPMGWQAENVSPLETLEEIAPVKVQGFRIEVDEIETALRFLPEVQDAAVVVREEARHGKRLVAYITLTSQSSADPATLLRSLREILPAYMLPSSFVIMEQLPLTPSGKIDRDTLSARPVDEDRLADPSSQKISMTRVDHGMLRSIRKSLGIHDALKSDADLVALIEDQLPVASISALIKHGILEKEIYSLIVPRRTLQHRRARKERLSREESDRAVRVARLAVLTEKVFENHDSGMHWLRSPKKRFHGRTPMAMMETEAGSRLVEEALYQIDEGMAA